MRCGVEVEVKFNIKAMPEIDGKDKGKVVRDLIKKKLEELIDEDVKLVTGTIYIIGKNQLLYNFIYETNEYDLMNTFKAKLINFEVPGMLSVEAKDIIPDARTISVITDIIEGSKLKDMDISAIYLEVYSKFNLFFSEFPTKLGYSVIAGGLVKNMKDAKTSAEEVMCVEFGIMNTNKEELDDLIHDLKCAEFVLDAVVSSAVRAEVDINIQ